MVARLMPAAGGFRKAVENFSWLIVQFGARLFASLLAVGLAARYLGVEGFGVYAFVVALVLILTSIATVGIQGIAARDLVEDPAGASALIGTAVLLRLVAGIVAWGVGVGLAVLANRSELVVVGVMIVGAGLLFRPLAVYEHYFEARVEGRAVAVAQIVGSVVLLASTIFAIRVDLGLYGVLAARLIDSVAVSVCLWWLGSRSGLRLSLRSADASRARSLAREGLPIAIAIAGATLNNRIDQLMLGIIKPSELGIYAAAVRLSETFYVVPGFVVASVFPRLVVARKRSGYEFERAVFELSRLITWLGIAVSLVIVLVSPWLVKFVFGSGYEAASPVLRISVWATAIMFNQAIVSRWLIIERATKYALLFHSSGALVNVLLNIFLIPTRGAQGAALATVISYAVAGLGSLWIVATTRPLARLLSRSFLRPPTPASWIALRCVLRSDQ